MCFKTLFNPAGPCCGSNSLCIRWPEIDFANVKWKVTTPDAEWLDVDTTITRRTGLINYYTWNAESDEITGSTSHPSIDDAGTDYLIANNVGFGPRAHWYRGGSYLAQHSGNCLWSIYNREELVHKQVAIVRVELSYLRSFFDSSQPAIFMAGAQSLLTPEQLAFWTSKSARVPEIFEIFNGVPFPNGQSGELVENQNFVGLSDVLSRLACYWLPFFAESNSPAYDTNYVFPVSLLTNLRSMDPSTWPGIDWLYQPTALELAASQQLSPGMLFGVLDDARSPLHGQFLPFEGATWGTSGDPELPPFVLSVPWELSTGAIRAELGFVNRWERTNENAALPDWIEIELVNA